ncbi:HAD family hydrolase [bacterium]|nr:HAD family hydrolase [bacterium]
MKEKDKIDRAFHAVIFDLDGTLLNSVEDIADSMNTVLKEMGDEPHPVHSYKSFTGEGIYLLVRRALPQDKQDNTTIEKCVQRMKVEYSKRWFRKSGLYEGIPGLLDELSGKGIKMNVLSNKPDEFTKRVVYHFLRQWSFERVVGGNSSRPQKPQPHGAIQISRDIKVPPAHFLYLGDSGTDMKTARSARMFAVGALWGFRDRKELIHNGAQKVVKSPSEVLDFFI